MKVGSVIKLFTRNQYRATTMIFIEPILDFAKTRQTQYTYMLLFTTTVIEKKQQVELVNDDPARRAWIWDQTEQKRKRSDGKRRVTFIRGKFKFDPPFGFDRLEQIPDRYEIPDWVEEEDNRNKKSREKKQTRGNKPKKGKKKQINRSIEPASTGRQRHAQKRFSRNQEVNVPSEEPTGEVKLFFFINF